MLDRSKILSADDRVIERVHVPDWGGDVCIRLMTGIERDKWESDWLRWRREHNGDEEDNRYFRAFLCAHSVCDENGVLLFSESDVESLGAKSGRALTLLVDRIMRLNGIGAAAVEENEKNLSGGRNG